MCISRYKGCTTQNLLVYSGGLSRHPLHRLDHSRQPHVATCGCGSEEEECPQAAGHGEVLVLVLHAGNLETDDEV